MTIYEAPRLEPFAGSAPEDEIKTFEAWGRGLGIAFDETNGYPEMEGINGLFNTISKYILYLQQNGISEWKSGVVYPLGAGVRVGAKWYKAKRQNINKAPENSQDDWLNLFDALPEASTSQKGITQLVNDLTSGGADKAITAEAVKQFYHMFANLKNKSGYQQLANGLILQWCEVTLPGFVSTGSNSVASFTFPTAFPNEVLMSGSFIKTAGKNSNWGDVSTWVTNESQTSATVVMATASYTNITGKSTAKVFLIGF